MWASKTVLLILILMMAAVEPLLLQQGLGSIAAAGLPESADASSSSLFPTGGDGRLTPSEGEQQGQDIEEVVFGEAGAIVLGLKDAMNSHQYEDLRGAIVAGDQWLIANRLSLIQDPAVMGILKEEVR